MRAVLLNKKNETAKILDNFDDCHIPEDNNELIWLDLEAKNKKLEKSHLRDVFGISDLSINDAYLLRHPPKYEKFPNYSFILIKAFDAGTEDIDFNILHISFFLADNFLITVHSGESPSINAVFKSLKQTSFHYDAYTLAGKILKAIIMRYTKVMLRLEDRLEEIESEMLESPNDKLLGELIRYNSKTQYLTRIFSNQHLVIEEILKQEQSISSGELRHKYIDLDEHMNRLYGLSALLNGVTKNLIDGYISVSSHRLNNIMKILTIVAVIFLPLTFLAGIYGMNFQHMPELSSRNGYFIILAVMVGLAAALLALFRKLKWI